MTDETLQVTGATPAPAASPFDGHMSKGASDAASYEAYADASKVEVGESGLAALQSLAAELLACEANVAATQAAVVRATEALKTVAEQRLPDLMEKYRLPLFAFFDERTGIKRTIELNKKWRVAMPPKSGKTADPQWRLKHDTIFTWLGTIGKGGVIKKDIGITAGLVSDEKVIEIMATIKESYPQLDVAYSKYVEPATLTALVSRMKDAGDNVSEFLKVSQHRVAEVSAK